MPVEQQLARLALLVARRVFLSFLGQQGMNALPFLLLRHLFLETRKVKGVILTKHENGLIELNFYHFKISCSR